jgi:hypothetical protein
MRIKDILGNKLNLNPRVINNNCIQIFLRNTKGNLSILMALVTIIAALLFINVFDLFQLYFAREHTKNASDSIALAVAQNLLYFEEDEIFIIADELSKKNDCDIDSIKISYEEITVTTVKKVKFIFAGRILKNSSIVYSTSKVKVTYPWDERFKNCDWFEFGF